MSITKIYKIICDCCDGVYIGKTKKKLYQRLYIHKWNAKNGKTAKLHQHMREINDYSKFKIILVEECKDMNAEQSKAREHHWICHFDTVKNGLNGRYENQLCQHDKKRYECVECDGSSICEHKKIKRQCKECDGSSICQHNKRKSICIECGGTQICQHDKRRRACKICSPVLCRICDITIGKAWIKGHLKTKKHLDKEENISL